MDKERESGVIIVAENRAKFLRELGVSCISHHFTDLSSYETGEFIAVDPLLADEIDDELKAGTGRKDYREGDHATQIRMVREAALKIHQSRQEKLSQSNP